MRHYILDGGTEVLDCQTGLIWRRDFAENLTFDQAFEYAERVARETGQAWRVPTIDELASLVDRGRCSPASAFPDMPGLWFWSSSPCVGFTQIAWIVSFFGGYVDGDLRFNNFAVRLVRTA
jgi:hypothetical protein